MSIWCKPVTFEKIERLQQDIDGQGTLMSTLNIKVTVIGEDSLTAICQLDQPYTNHLVSCMAMPV